MTLCLMTKMSLHATSCALQTMMVKKQANRIDALMTAMHPARPASSRFDLLQQIKNIHLRNEAEEIKWRIEQ